MVCIVFISCFPLTIPLDLYSIYEAFCMASAGNRYYNHIIMANELKVLLSRFAM